ncbi:ExeA family protein [Photobacterium sp. OFAV2-7]|uniref:ExeA family protein n=1 Tax=Photobacterium sp. OFAV2-7 TaxID=2917748 RepID=UPI001EF73643|nr:AAA family ATPase [Photobacterium sp. OFAV2-7]MCG7584297.1 AAA family ATPase [Photobacterium sp. OFAV2-7]
MYQSHFGLEEMPFSLTPNTALFYALPPHLEAIQTTLAALEMGEGIIQISGEVGTGKTLVCRMLIKQLPQQFELAYLPTPAACGDELRLALARELAISVEGDNTAVTEQLQQALIERKAAGKSVVVLLDEAQALPDDALETLRLLGNLETEQEKLLHIVLLGQPELDQRLDQHHMRQLRQRITFRACLRPLDLAETIAYIEFRLNSAGCQRELFELAQYRELWKASQGIPRLINQLCHKALIAASSSNAQSVGRKEVLMAVKDTLGARQPKWTYPVLWGWH